MENRDQEFVEIGGASGFRRDPPAKTYARALPDVQLTETPIELQEVCYSEAGKGTRRTYSCRQGTFLEFRSSTPPRGKLHKHDYFELMVIASPRFTMQVESRQCGLGRGDVCILSRATRHAEHFDPGTAVVYLVLSPQYLLEWPREEGMALPPELRRFIASGMRDPFQQNKDYALFRARDREDPALLCLLEELRRELEDKRPGYQLFARGFVYRLFCLLADPARYAAEYAALGLDDGFSLAFAARQLLDKAGRRMTGQEVAQGLHYSAGHINRVFQKHYGCTLSQYGRRVCLEQAAALLRGTDRQVQDICKRLGFANRTHFYRLFQQEYGCTPAQYRRRTARLGPGR